MRLMLAMLAFGVAGAAAVAAEPKVPYKAYLNAHEVYVRSGPGQSYYPTDKLTLGQEVEVYRHDPGGWCAIRPVDGSHSWVAAKYVKPEEGNLAVVTEDQVACRVGSRFSEIRDVIQIRLHRGEVVELIEPKRGDTQGWHKIAPPSGEFRWVFGKYLDPEYPKDGLGKHSDRQTAAARHDESAADAKASRKSAAVAADGARALSPEEFQSALDDVDLELSTMVIEEPTVWSFDSLRQRSETLLSQADTALERGRTRLLANKIARFADIKQRFDAVAALKENTERSNRELASLSPRQVEILRPTEFEGRFDAVGRLSEVSSPKAGAPRYALLDEQGRVRCYVSPTAGVNLRYYVGRQVGINGTRGYMPEQHANHLMARHVSAVEDGMLR